jgi:hypothetical protein
MKVLLVHPEDPLPSRGSSRDWDLIVDFGRAPASTYQHCSTQAACPVISVYEFAREIEDLRLCRSLLQLVAGRLLDRHGIDWWDVLSLGLVPGLLQVIRAERLAKYIGHPCELHSTRPFPTATAVQSLLGCNLKIQDTPFQSTCKRFGHYSRVISKLDAAQIFQVIEDKFDRHRVRSKLLRTGSSTRIPLILLPSAYVNVSRMAMRYAELLPDQQFLLVFARRSGKLQSLPANVLTVSLSPYFGSLTCNDQHLFDEWPALRQSLVCLDNTFALMDRAGTLEGVEARLRWGLHVRDAWRNVFDREPIIGCLSADDTNPYTRIPLLLAKNRDIPAVACHHGALDCWMTLKSLAADFYLAKNEMERDYLVRTCDVTREKIVSGGPARPPRPGTNVSPSERNWLVFFTEPYEVSGWRTEDVYRDLLPRLYSLARNCGLKLVFKLHPFDSVRGHRKNLRRILGQKAREVELLAGPPSDKLWCKTKFALTVDSSTALDCAACEIPVFLCAWLRDPYAGYGQQYAKFGVGHALESPERIADIPHLLGVRQQLRTKLEQSLDPEVFRGLFLTNTCLAAASNG